MQFDWWTLALQTINFVVLVWLLHRFLYKPVLRLVDQRRAMVESRLEAASKTEAEAAAKLVAIEAERESIAEERSAMLKAAAVQAEKAAASRMADASREAEAIAAAGRKTLANERDTALAEARHLAVDLGLDIARRLLGEIPAELRAQAWLGRIEQQLASMSPEDLAAIGKVEGTPAKLQVVTAIEMPAAVIDKWRDLLRQTLGGGSGLEIDFAVDPALVAGAEIHFPQAVLRFSWRSALAVMRAEIEGDENTVR